MCSIYRALKICGSAKYIVLTCQYVLYSIAAYDGQIGQVAYAASKGQPPYMSISYPTHIYHTLILTYTIHIKRCDRIHDLATSS